MPRRVSERERIRNLIALDAEGVMRRLEERKDEMIAMFSRHREREPLLSPLHSWLPSARFAELALLLPEQQAAVTAFHEELDALRWYFRYTADMPGTAQQVFARHRGRLRLAHLRLRELLGPAAAPVPAPARRGRRRRASRRAS